MTETNAGERLSIARLIMMPALITLAVSLLRLVGELEHWSKVLFNPTAGGGAAIVGITWLAFIFGVYLTLLMLTGIEHQQAFTVLGHPGYKHFVRLCIHRDGKVEAWAIGKDDVLAEGLPLMIDRFEWKP